MIVRADLQALRKKQTELEHAQSNVDGVKADMTTACRGELMTAFEAKMEDQDHR